MTIFSVIKYQNIDIGDIQELLKLPPELINIYYDNFVVDDWSKVHTTYYVKCNYLSYWVRPDNEATYRTAFKKALAEYDVII